MKSLLSLLAPKQRTSPLLRSYGQRSCGINSQTIQEVIQWLIFSLLQYGYCREVHLFWMEVDDTPIVIKQLKRAIRKGEPIFMYRCSDRSPSPPDGYYWRMMSEHRSMRVYQLEMKED
ncbi:MAG: hypothetical protein KME10_10035 [Plectolyngbya sp. WJT66-NPBG17]|jgi:hypothetical protein|nr:hypothetical protein [Plectolyngbya sp. WJT66-NPBG17]MBW4525598.1 hypothetical protein [Phormidium tanganyikae FI6-MK23]